MAISGVEQSVQNTIQSNIQNPQYTTSMSMLMVWAQIGDVIAPWWSKERDNQLRNFVKLSDHVSGAIYNMLAKMTAIPVRVVARDESIKAHVELANQYTDMLINGSQFGEGWTHFFGRYVEDLLSQDNGAFAEIIGPGDPSGPLTGAVISLANLDSCRCTRTGDPIYPVVYEDTSGRLYKLHGSRVLYSAQMPSPKATMNGVGFCAVSRMINAAQNLYDISVYKQEKLGSRPPRQMMITGGGLDPEDLQTAMRMAESSMNNQGLRRFSKTIVAGNRNIPDPKLQVVDMAKVPEGFNEKESTILAMSVVAMALGMDAKELFPALESGATKADAIVQHMKQRGKGPGQILEDTERLYNYKVLPPVLRLSFDYQDDAQDHQIAEIRSIRSQSRQRNLVEGVTNKRIERELMMSDGEISSEQFETLELEDGRLADGTSVEVLFYSKDKAYTELLRGVTESNYEEKSSAIMEVIVTSRDAELIRKARRALAAIQYKFVTLPQQKMMEEARAEAMLQPTGRANRPTGNSTGNGQGRSGSADSKTDTSYQSERGGRKLGRDETTVRGDMQRT